MACLWPACLLNLLWLSVQHRLYLSSTKHLVSTALTAWPQGWLVTVKTQRGLW